MSHSELSSHSLFEDTIGRIRDVRSRETALKIVDLLEEHLPELRKEILDRKYDVLPPDTAPESHPELRIREK